MRMKRILLIMLVLLMLPVTVALAHDTCCVHDHLDNNLISGPHTCDTISIHCSEPWQDWHCVDKKFMGWEYCTCLSPDYALLLVNTLIALDGPPAQDTTVSYQTSIGPDSYGELRYDDETVVAFEPNMAGPGGFLSLRFGSFADPAVVPVTVEQWFFEFPPGMINGIPTGPSSTALDPGGSAQLIYNSDTNELFTPSGESILLTLTNEIHTDAPLRLEWFGLMQLSSPDGDVLQQPLQGEDVLQVLIQSVPNEPPSCEGDFDNDGDVDGSDLAVFAADFGRTDCDSVPPCEGNFDADNDVDGSDLAVFAGDFGRTNCLP